AHYLKDGLARIAVSDPWIADNHAIFTVVIREGRAVHIETDPIMTGREPGSCDFDIWMPISVFSAAITGNFSLGDFDFMENVTYDETKAELLAGIFYRKDCFINNYF
ncbi:MAG TPA: hypothetical protein PLU43_05980, partial [Lachnospiraceae bacterium]|nr:hypothetical protein [Lachnospiraceae bacterium]